MVVNKQQTRLIRRGVAFASAAGESVYRLSCVVVRELSFRGGVSSGALVVEIVRWLLTDCCVRLSA